MLTCPSREPSRKDSKTLNEVLYLRRVVTQEGSTRADSLGEGDLYREWARLNGVSFPGQYNELGALRSVVRAKGGNVEIGRRGNEVSCLRELERLLGHSRYSAENEVYSLRGLAGMDASPPDELTNFQKLTLSRTTIVGKAVAVTDGFYVSGFGDARDGFYFPFSGTSLDSDTNAIAYLHAFPLTAESIYCFHSVGFDWRIGNSVAGFFASNADATNPWDATWVAAALTLTHPAAQTLAAPSSAQGGVYVAGGTQDGVYTVAADLSAGKSHFFVVGGNGSKEVRWVNDTIDRWEIVDSDGVGGVYYSLSAVATPDLASNWLNTSDDTPASITVTNLTSGELAAGVVIAGTDFYQNQGLTYAGRQVYTGIGTLAGQWVVAHASGTVWYVITTPDNTGSIIATSDTFTPLPWNSDWTTSGLTVQRDDVCAEQNWLATP